MDRDYGVNDWRLVMWPETLHLRWDRMAEGPLVCEGKCMELVRKKRSDDYWEKMSPACHVVF